MVDKLQVLISSTGDLENWRSAAKAVLEGFNIYGDRFEFWPALSEPPIKVCMWRVYRSDAIVFILGKIYGSIVPELGISYTHAEYKYADQLNKSIFVYLINAPDSEREPLQLKFFTEEIKNNPKRLYKLISSIEEFKEELKQSFQEEFMYRFRLVSIMKDQVKLGLFDLKQLFQKEPTENQVVEPSFEKGFILPETTGIVLSDEVEGFFAQLKELHQSNKFKEIQELAQKYEEKYKGNPKIMSIFYMADINLALDGVSIPGKRLLESFDFFESEEAKAIWPPFILKYDQANVLLALNNVPGAIKLYKEVIDEKPDFLLARVNLGNVYRKVKNYKSALKSYEEALEYGKPMELLFNIATLLIQEGEQPERALSYLEQIVVSDLHPEKNRESYYWWKAKANLLLERYPEGIAAIEEVLGNSPEEEGAWWDAAKLYVKAYRQDKHYLEPAVNFWNRFLEKLPGIGAAWAELGYVHWNLREIKDKADNCRLGINAYRKSIDLRVGDEALAWAYIGRLYLDLNEYEAASQAYKNAADLKPDEFGYSYGESLYFLRKFKEALPWIEASVKQDELNPIKWTYLGDCQGYSGHIDDAERSYLKAIELDEEGKYPKSRFELGGLYWNKRDILEAVKVWGDAVERFPDYPDVKQVRDILRGTKFESLITWPSS